MPPVGSFLGEFNEAVKRHAGRALTADTKELSQRRNDCRARGGVFTSVLHARQVDKLVRLV